MSRLKQSLRIRIYDLGSLVLKNLTPKPETLGLRIEGFMAL